MTISTALGFKSHPLNHYVEKPLGAVLGDWYLAFTLET